MVICGISFLLKAFEPISCCAKVVVVFRRQPYLVKYQDHIMARTAQIRKEKIQSFITLRHEGQSMRNISRTFKVSSSAVAKTIKHYVETGSHEDRHRKGRPRVTSAVEDNFIRVASLRNRQLMLILLETQTSQLGTWKCKCTTLNAKCTR